MRKYRQLIMGMIIGAFIMLSAGVMANTNTHLQVPAWLVNNVQFIFNGEYKSVPTEYGGVLIYNDRTYVPTRFVAESLDAEVNWNEETRTATISSKPCPVCPEQPEEPSTDDDQNNNTETEEPPKESDSDQPKGDYRKLPINKYYQDIDLTVKTVIRSGDYNNTTAEHKTHTLAYVRLENKGTNPIQLQQSKTKAIVDGKEYKTEGMPSYQLDDKWYNDLYEEDVVEGYIALPLIPEDAKEMKLKLYVVENSWKTIETEVEFDIALELNQ